MRLWAERFDPRLWEAIGPADLSDFPRKEGVEAALGGVKAVDDLYAAALSVSEMAWDTRRKPMRPAKRLGEFRNFVVGLRDLMPAEGPIPEWLIDCVLVTRGYIVNVLKDKAPSSVEAFERACPAERQEIASDPRAAMDRMLAELDRLIVELP